MNPNARIPAAVDDAGPGGAPIRLWESAAIMLSLAEKHGSALLPADARRRQEVLHWLFFQMGSQGPIAGQFAHFFMRCPLDRVEARDYGIDRYGTMVMYACDVLDRALDGREYLVGDGLTLADLACYPWFEWMRTVMKEPGKGTTVADFMRTARWKHLNAWADRIKARPAVQRGMTVNGFGGKPPKPWLVEQR